MAYQVNEVATGISELIDFRTAEMQARQADMSKPHIVGRPSQHACLGVLFGVLFGVVPKRCQCQHCLVSTCSRFVGYWCGSCGFHPMHTYPHTMAYVVTHATIFTFISQSARALRRTSCNTMSSAAAGGLQK